MDNRQIRRGVVQGRMQGNGDHFGGPSHALMFPPLLLRERTQTCSGLQHFHPLCPPEQRISGEGPLTALMSVACRCREQMTDEAASLP